MYQIKVFQGYDSASSYTNKSLETIVNEWLRDNAAEIKEVINVSVSTFTDTSSFTDKMVTNYTVLYTKH